MKVTHDQLVELEIQSGWFLLLLILLVIAYYVITHSVRKL